MRAVKYELDPIDQVYAEERAPNSWAVVHNRFVLSKDGNFEYEPMPSERDEDFLIRCRFGTAEEAAEAFRRKK